MGNTLKRGKQQKKDSGIDTSTVRCEVRNTLIVLAHSILLCVCVCVCVCVLILFVFFFVLFLVLLSSCTWYVEVLYLCAVSGVNDRLFRPALI